MYEDMTYEKIMENMLGQVRKDVDKREGSVIWDATAATAYSLAEMYFELSNYPDLIFPDTAVGEFLDRFVSVFGIERKAAVKARRKILGTGQTEIGSRWGGQDTTYVIVSQEDEYFVAECEQYGDIGNQYFGEIQPLSGQTGSNVTLGEVLLAGSAQEEDDQLRARFLEKVRKPSTSGNVNDYYNWALSCRGVGAVKVLPLADGPGTVTVIITNEKMKGASEELVGNVLTYIERLRPIGATVTVTSATEKVIDICAKVRIGNTLDINEVKEQIKAVIERYFQENTFRVSYVSLARIGNLLMDVKGVEDYTDLMLNGEAANVIIGQTETAVVGNLDLEVILE